MRYILHIAYFTAIKYFYDSKAKQTKKKLKSQTHLFHVYMQSNNFWRKRLVSKFVVRELSKTVGRGWLIMYVPIIYKLY